MDASPCLVSLVFVMMSYYRYNIVIGFLSRTLPDFRIIWNPPRLWNHSFCRLSYAAITSFFSGRLMSLNIFFGS